jgi:DNA-binding CsgD family transcriptional regulator
VSDQLNQREIELLQLLADGKTQGEAARKLKLSERTITKYTVYVREKLEAFTTNNAIATAIRRGLID